MAKKDLKGDSDLNSEKELVSNPDHDKMVDIDISTEMKKS